jgi:hypothetical protein
MGLPTFDKAGKDTYRFNNAYTRIDTIELLRDLFVPVYSGSIGIIEHRI